MRPRSRQPISLIAVATLVFAVMAAVAKDAVPAAVAGEPTLSGAQLQKINGWIAEQGRDVAVSAIITDILGLTKGDATISCRAFAAAGDGNEIHQIYVLPVGKGYLDAHFYKDKLDVYRTDKDFVLIAALSGVRGQPPGPVSFTDAQYGFRFEVAWWAKFTDGH